MFLRRSTTLLLGLLVLFTPRAFSQSENDAASKLFAMTNESRVAAGLASLQWDQALANAAYKHCQWMVQNGTIGHQYAGEPDLATRTAQAGAHFNLVEENVAIAPNAVSIHQGWMNSPGHRKNLLNTDINRVGIAIIITPSGIYAAADYARSVEVFSQEQVEAIVRDFLRAKGVSIEEDNTEAHVYCVSDGRQESHNEADFLMKWQTADATDIPLQLLKQLKMRQYLRASVASCAPQKQQSGFTLYNVAVLMYSIRKTNRVVKEPSQKPSRLP